MGHQARDSGRCFVARGIHPRAGQRRPLPSSPIVGARLIAPAGTGRGDRTGSLLHLASANLVTENYPKNLRALCVSVVRLGGGGNHAMPGRIQGDDLAQRR